MPAKPLDDKALVYRIDVPCETCSAGIGEACKPDCEENAGNVPEDLDGKSPVLRLAKQVKDLEAKVALLTLEKEKAYDVAIDAAKKACEDYIYELYDEKSPKDAVEWRRSIEIRQGAARECEDRISRLSSRARGENQ